MHIKVDEDLPPAVAQLLRDRGYASSTVVDQGFGDIRLYPPGSHCGVLLLRPGEDGIRPLLELMEQVLASLPHLGQLSGALAVASPQGLRVRRAES